jgi:S-adenosylmethionine hydrolase
MLGYAVTPRVITLTTDFGIVDAYVAVMKGVIITLESNTHIVDLSHEVRPQDVAGAAFLIQSAYRYFPKDAIHVAVVDPGVGTPRKAIAIQSPVGCFVGPDNGLFSPVLAEQQLVNPEDGRLRGKAVVVELTEQSYWLQPVSHTFHGRDIFAPAAAHLARGVEIGQLGRTLQKIHPLNLQPPVSRGGIVYGTIIHLDRFGNAISNIPESMLPPSPALDIAGRTLHGISESYQEGQVVAIVGSVGLIEIAARNASAADILGLREGDRLTVREDT